MAWLNSRSSDFNEHGSLAPVQGYVHRLAMPDCAEIRKEDCAKFVSWNDINDMDCGWVTLILALASAVSGCSI